MCLTIFLSPPECFIDTYTWEERANWEVWRSISESTYRRRKETVRESNAVGGGGRKLRGNEP